VTNDSFFATHISQQIMHFGYTVQHIRDFKNLPNVIARGLANMNTIPAFRAIVSCLSDDSSGNATTINLTTDPFPATIGLGAGNAHIKANLNLPIPCIAPIVFITSPTGVWFAATGN
jgi:hypothetical protein